MPNRKPNRLKDYNYSNENLYFATICVKNRVSCFGDITDEGEMQLNDYGQIAKKQWDWLVERYQYICSHAFVVMPNHIHGILEIRHTPFVRDNNEIVRTGRDLSKQDINTSVSTGRDLSQNVTNTSVRTGHNLSHQDKPYKIKSLSELIGAYKTTTSKQIHLLGYEDFSWQRSFHDHIIRNETSCQNIINYINENPNKWANDKCFTE